VETGSPVVYGLEFARPDGGYVTCFWTTRGRRPATLAFGDAAAPVHIGVTGRSTALPLRDGAAACTITVDPAYITSATRLTRVLLGEPEHATPDGEGRGQLIDAMDDPTRWTVETERSYELETFNFLAPRRPGDFRYATVATLDGRRDVMTVTPKPVAGSEYLHMYSVLRLNQPVQLTGRPTEIGLWVHGNGGWGRIIFELTDASGQRWISIGSEMSGKPNPWMADWMPAEEFAKLQDTGGAGISSWNSNDAWGRSVINHEGWRFIRFPLPGNYGEGVDAYHWPATSQWRFSERPKVTYPLTFQKLIITLPEKVLHLDRYEPVAARTIGLADLQVTDRALDAVIADAESAAPRDQLRCH
jgi:hypothetical protein